MFSRVATLLVVACVLSQSLWTNIAAASAQNSTSPDFTEAQIRQLMTDAYTSREYWLNLDMKLNSREFKQNPVLSKEMVVEFQKYVTRQIRKYDIRVNNLTEYFGYFINP